MMLSDRLLVAKWKAIGLWRRLTGDTTVRGVLRRTEMSFPINFDRAAASDAIYVTPEQCDAYVQGLKRSEFKLRVDFQDSLSLLLEPLDVRDFRHVQASVRFLRVEWYAESWRFRGRVTHAYADDASGERTLEAHVKPVTPVERVPAELWRRLGYRVLRLFRSDG
jgi:hypothetical protein